MNNMKVCVDCGNVIPDDKPHWEQGGDIVCEDCFLPDGDDEPEDAPENTERNQPMNKPNEFGGVDVINADGRCVMRWYREHDQRVIVKFSEPVFTRRDDPRCGAFMIKWKIEVPDAVPQAVFDSIFHQSIVTVEPGWDGTCPTCGTTVTEGTNEEK